MCRKGSLSLSGLAQPDRAAYLQSAERGRRAVGRRARRSSALRCSGRRPSRLQPQHTPSPDLSLAVAAAQICHADTFSDCPQISATASSQVCRQRRGAETRWRCYAFSFYFSNSYVNGLLDEERQVSKATAKASVHYSEPQN